MHGYLEFSDPPEHYTYPLSFPIKDWPKRNDPSFIGIFFSKCRIGQLYQTDHDQRIPGIYFRYVQLMKTSNHTNVHSHGVIVRPLIKNSFVDFFIHCMRNEWKENTIHMQWRNAQYTSCNHNQCVLYDGAFSSKRLPLYALVLTWFSIWMAFMPVKHFLYALVHFANIVP